MCAYARRAEGISTMILSFGCIYGHSRSSYGAIWGSLYEIGLYLTLKLFSQDLELLNPACQRELEYRQKTHRCRSEGNLPTPFMRYCLSFVLRVIADWSRVKSGKIANVFREIYCQKESNECGQIDYRQRNQEADVVTRHIPPEYFVVHRPGNCTVAGGRGTEDRRVYQSNIRGLQCQWEDWKRKNQRTRQTSYSRIPCSILSYNRKYVGSCWYGLSPKDLTPKVMTDSATRLESKFWPSSITLPSPMNE
jgi:hypothetical protein